MTRGWSLLISPPITNPPCPRRVRFCATIAPGSFPGRARLLLNRRVCGIGYRDRLGRSFALPCAFTLQEIMKKPPKLGGIIRFTIRCSKRGGRESNPQPLDRQIDPSLSLKPALTVQQQPRPANAGYYSISIAVAMGATRSNWRVH